MPITPTYPGVYIEEVPSGVRTIMGVATSITAFIGRALRGPVNEPTRIQSFADYQRTFGGLWEKSTMSYAVQQYYLNGGTDAIIVRLVKGAGKAEFDLGLTGTDQKMQLEAANEGAWGDDLRVSIDLDTRPEEADETNTLFNLYVAEVDPSTDPETEEASESFRNVSIDPEAPRYVGKVLEQESDLIRLVDLPETYLPVETDAVEPTALTAADGDDLTYEEYEGDPTEKTGIYALEDADLFNLLCIPPYTRQLDVEQSVWTKAIAYCEKRRAMAIIDPPSSWGDVADAESIMGSDAPYVERSKNAALFFPRARIADSLKENRLEEFAPCGVIAGVFARTDAARGVWKAPAGLEATLVGVRELAYKMTDDENGRLNPLAVNCLRAFPVVGRVVWGARTLEGADKLASEWKYVPVRRLALYLEESLYRGTQWVVFEPNDEPLWSQIRLNVGAFMHNLFRKGAFQGTSPREAYFVKCDKDTTTQNDIDRGIVNILVGFSPLKPAEFVIIKISQIAGQIET